MKFFKTFSALCIAIIMAMAVSACAPTAKSEGTGGLSGRYGSDDESEGRIIGREESKIDRN